MKWAIIAVVSLVVLGGVGYGIYTLTSVPEDAQEWWDEKKLDNFEVLANRELDDFEKKIAEHKSTQKKMKVDRILWAGHEELGDANFKEQKETGFWTLYGYKKELEHRTKQGEALAAAYKQAASAAGAAIDASTGELASDAKITCSVPQRGGSANSKEFTAEEVLKQLTNIENALLDAEANVGRVEQMVEQYDSSISAWDVQIAKEEEEIVELRRQVKSIAAEIKLQKAKEDLAELNKTISGESEDSELGKMIRGFENRKTKFKAEELVAADEGKKGGGSVSLDDLDKPATASTPKTSRFLK
jgi:phage shock protein A